LIIIGKEGKKKEKKNKKMKIEKGNNRPTEIMLEDQEDIWPIDWENYII
jgi:hypothetical protein